MLNLDFGFSVLSDCSADESVVAEINCSPLKVSALVLSSAFELSLSEIVAVLPFDSLLLR